MEWKHSKGTGWPTRVKWSKNVREWKYGFLGWGWISTFGGQFFPEFRSHHSKLSCASALITSRDLSATSAVMSVNSALKDRQGKVGLLFMSPMINKRAFSHVRFFYKSYFLTIPGKGKVTLKEGHLVHSLIQHYLPLCFSVGCEGRVLFTGLFFSH